MTRISSEFKRQIFVKEYLIDKNATRAAKAAGFSAKTAKSSGQRLLTRVDVQKKISEAIGKQISKLEIKAEDVLREIHRVAMVDIGDAYDEKGLLKPLSEIPEATRRSMSSIEVEELYDGQGDNRSFIGISKKVKFWDKMKGLEMLAKHFKLLTDVHEHVGNENQPVVMKVEAHEVKKVLKKIREEY